MGLRVALFLVFFHSTIRLGEANANFIESLDFGIIGETMQVLADRATYPELRVWANYQGWDLDRDGDFGGYQNSVAMMVGSEGKNFYLSTDSTGKETVYLNMDLVRFTPGPFHPLRPQVLEIRVNGRKKRTVAVGPGKNFQNPIEVELDPKEFVDGRIVLYLQPLGSPESGRYWGVWDVFLTRKPLTKRW